MWCSRCQLDVPGIASPKDERRIHCARCSHRLTMESETVPPPKEGTLDDWDLEADLREVERLAGPRSADAHEQPLPSDRKRTYRRIDAGTASNGPAPEAKPPRTHRSPFVAWCLLALGLMVFAFGGGLSVWSLLTSRVELWNLGMPVTVAGQGLLLLGLLLQLDALWQSARESAKEVSAMQAQVEQLEKTINSVVTQGGSAQSFYGHLSAGASPHLLLADLKGQMDVLSVKLGNDS